MGSSLLSTANVEVQIKSLLILARLEERPRQALPSSRSTESILNERVTTSLSLAHALRTCGRAWFGRLGRCPPVKFTATGNMARFGTTRVRLGKISSLAMSQHAVVTAGVEPSTTRFHRFSVQSASRTKRHGASCSEQRSSRGGGRAMAHQLRHSKR